MLQIDGVRGHNCRLYGKSVKYCMMASDLHKTVLAGRCDGRATFLIFLLRDKIDDGRNSDFVVFEYNGVPCCPYRQEHNQNITFPNRKDCSHGLSC